MGSRNQYPVTASKAHARDSHNIGMPLEVIDQV